MNIITSLRDYRIFDYAIFDLVLTFLGMWLLSPWLTKLFSKLGVYIPEISWLIWALPIGIAVHLLFGSITPMTKNFFEPNGQYLLKTLIIILIIIGFKGVKLLH